MTKLLDPKNDVVFQKLFGMKNHKNILISFLNPILNLGIRKKITSQRYGAK